MKNKKILSVVLAVIIISVAPMFASGAFDGIIRTLVQPTLVFNSVYTFRDGMAWVQRDGRVGFVNQYGEVVIPLEFDRASHFFHEGLAAVGRRCDEAGWTYGFIDMEGNLVIPYIYCYASRFRDGVARVRLDGKHGLIDVTGQVVIPIEYTSLGWGYFRYGLMAARIGDWTDGYWGVLDMAGNIVIPFEFSSLSVRDGGLIYARRGDWETGGQGILNRYGDVLVPFEYRWIDSFHEGLAAVHRDGMIGFVDESGELVVPLMYGSMGIRGDDPRWMNRGSHHGAFEDGFAVIGRVEWGGTDGNQFGLIDRAGNVILPFEFDIIHSFSDGLATVGVGEIVYEDSGWWNLSHTYGVVDMYGNMVIPLGEFDFIGYFSEGVASARRDGQSGLIDRDGNVVLPFEYQWINRFEDGVATARKHDFTGIIDRDGNVIIPFEFTWIGRFENGEAFASRDGRTGIIDREGNIIVPFAYNALSQFGDDLMMARRGDRQTGSIEFVDNDGLFVYALPEGTALNHHCLERNIARNGGIFWISTGDRQTGFQFGILQIASGLEDVAEPETAIELEIDAEPEIAVVPEVPVELAPLDDIDAAADDDTFWLFRWIRNILQFFRACV